MFRKQLSSRAIAAIREYLSQTDRSRPISVAGIVRAARSVMPDAGVGERELAELVSRELVLAGVNVDFDGWPPAATRESEAATASSSQGASAGKPLISRDVVRLDTRWGRRARMAMRKGRR